MTKRKEIRIEKYGPYKVAEYGNLSYGVFPESYKDSKIRREIFLILKGREAFAK